MRCLIPGCCGKMGLASLINFVTDREIRPNRLKARKGTEGLADMGANQLKAFPTGWWAYLVRRGELLVRLLSPVRFNDVKITHESFRPYTTRGSLLLLL